MTRFALQRGTRNPPAQGEEFSGLQFAGFDNEPEGSHGWVADRYLVGRATTGPGHTEIGGLGHSRLAFRSLSRLSKALSAGRDAFLEAVLPAKLNWASQALLNSLPRLAVDDLDSLEKAVVSPDSTRCRR